MNIKKLDVRLVQFYNIQNCFKVRYISLTSLVLQGKQD